MPVYRIVLTTLNSKGDNHFVNFEHPAGSIDELTELFAHEYVVSGQRLRTRAHKGAARGWDVIGREPIAIGRAAVHLIDVPNTPLFENGEGS